MITSSALPCIFFIPWPFPSHGTASLKLARTLRTGGHDVVYINIGKDDRRYAAHGFRSVVILEDVLPEGLLGVFQRYSGRRLTRELRHGLPALIDVVDRQLHVLIAEHQPAFAVVDRTLPYMVLLFHRAGIPAALLNVILPLERDPDVPPITSALPPPATPLGRLRNRLHWRLIAAREDLRARRLALRQTYRELALRCAYPLDKLNAGIVAGCHPEVAELITCPASFDLPHRERPLRFYIGPCVDLARIEPPFDWSLLNPARKLAYCALGSWPSAYPAALTFFVRLAQAFASMADWQAVIAAGDLCEPLRQRLAGNNAANLVVTGQAPQLSMLQRASVMVTHGGLGSIKEALLFGVPLVVFPARGDQFGNAARVAHHQLGLVGSLKRSSPSAIREIVQAAAASPEIRARVDAMQAEFVEAEQSRHSLEVVEQLMSWHGRPGSVDRDQEVHATDAPAHDG